MITFLRTDKERRKWLTIWTAVGLTVCAPHMLLAANQGNLGPSSSGSVNISLTVGHQVNISGLDDIALAPNSSGHSAGTSYACISNSSGLPIRLETIGSGPGGALILTSPDAALDYQLQLLYKAQPVAQNNRVTTLPANRPLPNDNCVQHGPNTRLQVTADRAAQPAAVYAGTLTLMVSAE